jgi:very-short-patch-repair endonuclease/predicted transcriptional regulator of viral defense system
MGLVDLFMYDLNKSPCLLKGANFDRWRLIEVVQPHVDQLIAELAARQHGVVSWRQLLALGLGRGAIEHRIRIGRLHRMHRGVYAVGHRRVSREGRWMAAVLACGDGAVLSHRSAAALWELRPSAAGKIDVTVPARSGRASRATIRVHRSGALPASEITRHQGIAVTRVARTLFDLAETVPRSAAQRALERAEGLQLFDLLAMQTMIDLHRTRRGSRRLAAILAEYEDDELTRSELENQFLALCADHGVPRPRVNSQVEDYTVDFFWPAQRLIAETDSRRYHATRAAFERDRARDAALTVGGYRVVRFTHRQIQREPASVAGTLLALIAAAT